MEKGEKKGKIVKINNLLCIDKLRIDSKWVFSLGKNFWVY